MYFFRKYFNEIDTEYREKIRNLVKQDKIDILNGGVAMNDEGTAYYDDIINQFTVGHRWVKAEFNITPKVAWSIDTFGHVIK